MITTKKNFVIGVMLFITLLMVMGCASTPQKNEPKQLEGIVENQVLEHKGMALGLLNLPVWVETYIVDGISGLEEMDKYKDEYCFMAEASGEDLSATQAWVKGFNLPQLIASNVSTRVEAAFEGASTGSTTGGFDTYFENVVRTFSETEFSGARQENDWWVLTRRYDPDNESTYTDEYTVYALYTIAKQDLEDQVAAEIEKTINENPAASAKALELLNKSLVAPKLPKAE